MKMAENRYKIYLSIYGDNFDIIGEANTFVEARRLGMIEYDKFKSSLSAAIKIEDVIDLSNTVFRQNNKGELIATFDEGINIYEPKEIVIGISITK